MNVMTKKCEIVGGGLFLGNKLKVESFFGVAALAQVVSNKKRCLLLLNTNLLYKTQDSVGNGGFLAGKAAFRSEIQIFVLHGHMTHL